MPTFEEARLIILENVTPVGSERVQILDSLGRALAEDIIAPRDMPLCDNSAMDGFAVRSVDCQVPVSLHITGFVSAGSAVSTTVRPGCAVKIMTGAPIPSGSDTVVPFEDTEESDGQVRIKRPVHKHEHIRFTGEDVRCGETIIKSGTIVRPAEISMLASCEKAIVRVYRRPRVSILSTGDELVEVGEPVAPGQVVNSNALALAAAVQECGAIPTILGIARDTRASHVEKMIEGLKADAFITSAGVSTGDRDLVREVLASLGVRELFCRLDMKPGAPTSFGLKDRTPVFCLPGNPVASMITFEELVKPALLKMMGYRRVLKAFIHAVLQDDVRKKAGKIKFLRVRLEAADGKWLAYSAGDQNTGMLKTMVMADGLALLPAERSSFSPGDEVEVHVTSSVLDMLEP